MAKYKQLCGRCKQNYVVVGWRSRRATCFECQKSELNGAVEDPQMQKMFDIPEEYYRQNTFLRNIKISYLRYGKLSDKQIEAFKKTVDEHKEKEGGATAA